jgi:uncharacterized protein YdhG (YjbR/CyaY superfamily)
LARRARARAEEDEMMKGTPKSTDAYLKAVPADQRAALSKLRQAIKAAAPQAEECISYQLPAFRLDGKFLACFGAAKSHCSLYPGSWAIEAHAGDLKKYSVSKGTIRFPADQPLPATLVKKLVKARIADMRGMGR